MSLAEMLVGAFAVVLGCVLRAGFGRCVPGSSGLSLDDAFALVVGDVFGDAFGECLCDVLRVLVLDTSTLCLLLARSFFLAAALGRVFWGPWGLLSELHFAQGSQCWF